MAKQVFFIDLRTKDRSLLDRLKALVEQAGIKKVIKKKALTAVKIHFGERGNTSFIRPLLVRPVVEAIQEAGGKPFLTDANTLYVGSRGNAVDHLNTAILNGFSPSVVGVPLIIADGIDGRDEIVIPTGLKSCPEAYIASGLVKADALVSLAHFKLHEVAGFGGAIKNVGMGGASRRGKMAQHSSVAPDVVAKRCIACGTCIEHCAHGAIAMADRSGTMKRPKPEISTIAAINPERCVGCAGCVHSCPQGAIAINWEQDLPSFMERMVDYTVAALKGKEKHALYVNFVTQVSPACDCYPFSDAPIVADVGILASTDIVAIDQACMDLVNAQPPLASSCIKDSPYALNDKVRAVYPKIDWEHQLVYAEQVGLGSRTYELVQLP